MTLIFNLWMLAAFYIIVGLTGYTGVRSWREGDRAFGCLMLWCAVTMVICFLHLAGVGS